MEGEQGDLVAEKKVKYFQRCLEKMQHLKK
jgi:hypothetical protein